MSTLSRLTEFLSSQEYIVTELINIFIYLIITSVTLFFSRCLTVSSVRGVNWPGGFPVSVVLYA